MGPDQHTDQYGYERLCGEVGFTLKQTDNEAQPEIKPPITERATFRSLIVTARKAHWSITCQVER
ncbi:hypothetical protein BRC86_02745 [Halobacteriales archaeon QS_3_64_16]|nr:MAG: hypothetical protein BRC86_02745 [Halobacteriales archaeon QS_3_64_16]